MHEIFAKSIDINCITMINFIKDYIDLKNYFNDTLEYKRYKTAKNHKLISIIKDNNTEYYKKILSDTSNKN